MKFLLGRNIDAVVRLAGKDRIVYDELYQEVQA
jgi:hypothetical protein